MLCKKCGRELPYAGGKFCPFCGAPVEQTGVSDETEVFTTLPEELRNAGGAPADGGIDLSAFDAARRPSRQARPDPCSERSDAKQPGLQPSSGLSASQSAHTGLAPV